MMASEQSSYAITLPGENKPASTPMRDGAGNPSPEFEVQSTSTSEKKRTCELNRTALAFFLMGILVGLPTMPTTAAANQMFEGITGVYGICLSLTAATSSFAGPIIAQYVPYDIVTVALSLASALAYLISTLPAPLSPVSGNKTGPVIGTMLGGFVYAFGTQNYLAVAAFFPAEAVVALSVGSGLSTILGSGIFIGLMKGVFDQDWRRCFLVFLPTSLGIPLVWWFLFDKSCRQAAERSRKQTLKRVSNLREPSDSESTSSWYGSSGREDQQEQSLNMTTIHNSGATGNPRPGFGPTRTRTRLVFGTLLPRYVLPLIICTTCAIFSLFGLAPTLQALNRFQGAPEGDLEFQLVYFAYGSAQFLFSTLVIVKPVPKICIWSGAQVVLTIVAIIQLWHPFLTHFWAWFVIMFLVGGCVGGGVSNTNYKIAHDFRKAGEPDEVRSFANRYAGLGNFGGDALGGALGLLIQMVVAKGLKPSIH